MHKGSLSHKKKSLSLKSWMHKKQNPEKFPTPIQFTFTLGTIKLEHTPSIPHQPRLLLIFFNSTISIIKETDEKMETYNTVSSKKQRMSKLKTTEHGGAEARSIEPQRQEQMHKREERANF